jgi:hypothetical protein
MITVNYQVKNSDLVVVEEFTRTFKNADELYAWDAHFEDQHPDKFLHKASQEVTSETN